MSEREPEPKTHKRKKSRRRSLRVPVDEVPRPTQAAGLADELGEDGGTTMEIPAFDEARTTFEEVARSTGVETDESVETELIDESIETDALDEGELDAPGDDAKDGEGDLSRRSEPIEEALLGAPRQVAGEPLAGEATVVQEPPSESAVIAGQADALVDEAPSVEVDIGGDDGEDEDDEDGEFGGGPTAVEALPEARETDPGPEPEAEPPPPKAPIVGVVVQRVVSIVSGPSSPPPLEEPAPDAADTHPGTELAVDIDDEEPEARASEAGDLEELDVDVDESEPQARRRDSAPELPSAEADELLEDEAALEAAALDEAEGTATKKRPSKRPPPPPSNKATKDAPPPPPEPEPPKAAPPRRAKARKAWYEELFNDDYLRTVPIPHPRVIQRQCDFIEQRFGLAQGATLLDVGCGLGLHAVELTRRGYLVVGLDLSLPMLSRAADEAQDHGFKINFLHADMREMNFDGAFDAVLCWGTTLGYFDDETNKQVVDRLYRALKPRGLLLLDVVNRDYLIRSQPNLVWFEGDGCVVMEESRMNYITSRLEVKRTVILDDGRQRDNVYSLRTYSLHELGQILHHQGFRVVEVTGWEAHPGVFFGSDSPKLMILAERRPAGPPTVPGRSTISGEMQAALGSDPAPPPDEAGGEDEAEAPETVAAAPPAEERPEPSPAVTEALLEALEKSGELEMQDDAEDLDPAELADEDE